MELERCEVLKAFLLRSTEFTRLCALAKVRYFDTFALLNVCAHSTMCTIERIVLLHYRTNQTVYMEQRRLQWFEHILCKLRDGLTKMTITRICYHTQHLWIRVILYQEIAKEKLK